MIESNRQHEQIRRFLEARFPSATLTDADIEKLARQQVVSYVCERELRDVNILLRTLPDDLLEHLCALASDLSNRGNLKELNTPPTELINLALIFSADKIREDEERFAFRIGIAVARLGAQVFVECARRAGHYSFVENYDLAREIRTAPRLMNNTGH